MEKMNIRKVVLMFADAFIVFMSGALTSFTLSFFWMNPMVDSSRKSLIMHLMLNMLMCFFALYVCGAYNKLWRYFDSKDYLSCFLGMLIGSGLTTLLSSTFNAQPRWQYIFISFGIGTFGVMLFRFIFRKAFLTIAVDGKKYQKQRTMIIGAGKAAHMILNEIKNAASDPKNPAHKYEPVCLIDDDPDKQGTSIMGIPIRGTTNDIITWCKKEAVDLIILAIPSLSDKDRKRILDIASETSCKIKIIPYLTQMLGDGNENTNIISKAQDIKIEDLLGREPVTFDNSDVKEYISGKVCMVTGGGGSIGSELVRQIVKYNPKQIVIVDIYENNAYEIQQELYMDYGSDINLVTLIASVRDYDKMNLIFKTYRPNIVFHAAAHKHVPLMETVPEEAVKNNIFGTFNCATLAEYYKTEKFVMISTDKAVNPTNVMGATKRCCEMIIQYMAQNYANTDFITTRFGNVLGSNGSVIPLFKKQIETGKPVTVTHPEIIRYFMTIPEAVSLVLQAGAMAHGGEIFVLDMGEPVKIVTLAENLIRLYGKVPYQDVEIKFTGLRPGEKLYEELLMNEEGLKETANKKIFIGNQIKINPDEFLGELQELKEAANANNSELTLKLLSDIVPTFHHNIN
ncbi:MAG: nucleoside-diphosphate sugar epimerase/dehydratase [Acutalibacteraceae bacterium]|nr:polysaccharide biosynthesis protein [Clostridia bacterium]MEE3450356.1 nucleoside-diphosphate sugar epimerase/dehydratase [Acutalibacteraceae bacterium]